MAVHIFTVTKENYEICIERGIVAIPEPKEDGKNYNSKFDEIASRMTGIKDDDFVLLYVAKPGYELRGIWQIDGLPFYEETVVWPDSKNRIFPFRCRIKSSPYSFTTFLNIDYVNRLKDLGKIWTWTLARASGANSMFSMSNTEFQILLTEFAKVNPFLPKKVFIKRPYPFHKSNILEHLYINDTYESTIMALLSDAFSKDQFTEFFGNYSDFLSYVPTSLGKEMDFLLMYSNPLNKNEVVSYDIIELKRFEFDKEALSQLIGYESWFLQKKASGNENMIRATAIGRSFSDEVIDYVSNRSIIERKPIKLFTYSNDGIKLSLVPVNK